ncbi:hypothetical protein N9300_00640 [bacterium]|nr:hypothetical protein [bacterium]
MKKILKLTAMLFGGAAMLLGLNSCDKEDDVNCCSFSDSGTYNGVSYSYSSTLCEDGTYTSTYTYGDDTETYSGNWDEWVEEGTTWAEIIEDYC